MFAVLIHYALLITQATIGFCLVLPLLLLIANCAITFFKKKALVSEELSEEKDYAIIVPAYSETETIQPLIDSLLQLKYTNYMVYVVVNTNSKETLSANNKNIVFLKAPTELKRKTYAYRYAIEHFKRPHTHITVIENNTIVDPEYLTELNTKFNEGYQAVQGVNVLQNIYSFSDIIYAAGNLYKHIFSGKVLFSLGSSAALTGGGAAFTVTLFKQCLIHINTTDESFTKALEYEIVNRGHRIAFAQNAFVFDNRTTDIDESKKRILTNIMEWLKGAPNNRRMIMEGILSHCSNRLLFGLALIQPSVFVILLLSLSCIAANMQMHPVLATSWLYFLFTFVLAFLISAGFLIRFSYNHKYKRTQRFMLFGMKPQFADKSRSSYSIAS